MSVQNWLILLVIYVAYLILGGFLFHWTECDNELEGKLDDMQIRAEIKEILYGLKTATNIFNINDSNVSKLEDYFQKKVKTMEDNATDPYCEKWNFQNSLFFSFTVVTTIGYGHQSAETPGGRAWCVVYAVIGIPLNAILIGSLGSVFSDKFKMFKMKMKQTFGDVESDTESNMKNRSKVFAVIVVESLIFTAFFTSIFLLLPAAIFTVLENDENNSWSYFDSIYFTFVTLSTIGFGDMVPDRQQNEKLQGSVWKYSYLVGIILWIIFGMGYIFAVIDVLSETFKSTSKPVKRVFRGLKNQIQVNDYWRRIIGEIILMKNGDVQSITENSMLACGSGGSEPCLGEYEGYLNLAMKKSVSTGDIHDGVEENVFTDKNVAPASAGHKAVARSISESGNFLQVPGRTVSSNFLAVPGGHLKTRASNSNISLEDCNEDTITSLREIFKNTKLNQPVSTWMENNFPDYSSDSNAPTRNVSRNASFNGASDNRANSSDQGPVRRSTMQYMVNRKNSVKSNFSRHSTKSSISAANGGAIGALLEQTTLAEFLTAAENVRKKSTMELNKADNEVKVESRKNSFLRKLSSNKDPKDGVMPQPLASLFNISKAEISNHGEIPLLQGGPSPTISDKVDHDALYVRDVKNLDAERIQHM